MAWRVLLILLALTPARLAAQDFFTLEGHGGPIKGIAAAPEGDAILTASFDYTVGYWQDRQPRWLEAHTAAVNAVTFVDAGRAVSGGDDFTVRLWDLATGESRLLGEHLGKVIGLAVSPDRNLVASASWDGSVGLWPLAGGPGWRLEGHDGAVNDVVFDPSGSVLLSASADGTIRVWDVATRRELRQIARHGFGVNRLVFARRGGWLAYGAVDGVTRVVDPATGAEIADFTGERRPILALALSPDETRLAVGDGEGYIMIVDTADWSVARDFHAAARGPVWALAFSASGANIHAAGISDTMFSFPLADLSGGEVIGTAERSFLRPPSEMSNGERQFARKCSICHTLTADGARRAGPPLKGLFGRRAGTVAGYNYSPALKDADFTWTAETVDDLFELGPDHFVPGSKMPMQRIAKPRDRDDLIAYLREATTQ